MSTRSIIKEIQAIRALSAEMVQRTSRLEEELAPVQARAPRKGTKGSAPVHKAVARRQEFLRKKMAQRH